MTLPPARVIAIVAVIAAGIAAFAVLRFSGFRDAPMAPGHGDEGELMTFECDANPAASPAITAHFDTLKEKITAARCSCAALTGVMQSLEDCCNSKAAQKEAVCGDHTSFGINCTGPDGGGLFGSSPGNPTLRVGFFGGFSRSNWSCKSAGEPNPDLEQMRKVFRSCCIK